MESCNLKETPTKGNEILSLQSSNATLSLKRLLQKHIRGLINALPDLEKAEKDGERHIISVANLLEQRECVESVEEINVQLISEFPDLKSRLLLKISAEVEKKINVLKSLLNPLKQLQQSMNQARTDLLSMASQRGKLIDPVALHCGTAMIPPLAVMMDSIQTVEKEARELHCSRIFYLEDIPEQSTVTSENFRDLWMEGATRILDSIKDSQQIVKYFLEEKL